MSKILLTQGDTLPYMTIKLTDTDSGLPIDVSASTTSVHLYFRAAESSALLSTITCTKTNGGGDGVVMFRFSAGMLDVPPGPYEGEVEINYDGDIQTVYDVLKFHVREQFN